MVKHAAYASMVLLAAVFASSCWTSNRHIEINVTCTKPIEINGDLLYPCGKCMSCRVQRTQEWSIRLMDEADSWDHSVFITLTYSDQELPDPPLVSKRELQLFLKRLRSSLETPIKYYGVGEYGTKGTCRPHYHLIIFGLKISDKPLIEKAWNKGIVDVGTVTLNSTRYVASYVQKKLYNQPDQINSTLFSIQSQGLGLSWALDNQKQLQQQQKRTVNGVPMGIPRYYVKKLELDVSTSQNSRVMKVEEELSEYKKLNSTSDLFDTNLRSKAQKNKNITARTNLKEKRL